MSIPYIISKLEWLSSTISTINGAIDINRANIAVLSTDTHKRLNDLEASRDAQRRLNANKEDRIQDLERALDGEKVMTTYLTKRIQKLEKQVNSHQTAQNYAPGDRPLFKVTVEEIK